MGYVKRPYQKDPIGDVRVFDAKPIWIGSSDKTPHIKRMMNTEEAESWVKESPDRRIIAKFKKGEL